MSEINNLEIIDITSIIDSSSKHLQTYDYFTLRDISLVKKYNKIYPSRLLLEKSNWLNTSSYRLNIKKFI